MRKSRLYRIWALMKSRCNNIKSSDYKDYGGRGINVCDEWLEFVPFMNWALANGYADDLTLDRKNNDGNYDPGNCQWITRLKQNDNKRSHNNIWLTLDDITDTLAGWARRTGLNEHLVQRRYTKLGWRGADLIKPVQRRG